MDTTATNRIMIRNSDSEHIITIERPANWWIGDIEAFKKYAQSLVDMMNTNHPFTEDYYVRSFELTDGDWIKW